MCLAVEVIVVYPVVPPPPPRPADSDMAAWSLWSLKNSPGLAINTQLSSYALSLLTGGVLLLLPKSFAL